MGRKRKKWSQEKRQTAWVLGTIAVFLICMVLNAYWHISVNGWAEVIRGFIAAVGWGVALMIVAVPLAILFAYLPTIWRWIFRIRRR
ncbi:MAG: hypothetical protein F4179_01035 [Gammaproteobacteria bacterium]|nr:hypothetical protein [Gammaproteobacteria bacterium]MYF60253.1 hypothetical protein [Gammaproteobacteria bacterium]